MNGVADCDSPWKEPEFLDKEMQQILRGAARGRQVVDLPGEAWPELRGQKAAVGGKECTACTAHHVSPRITRILTRI
jgi:hypothetical protein